MLHSLHSRLVYNHYAYNAANAAHKAVTGRVEDKKLLSSQRQSKQSVVHMHKQRNAKKGFFRLNVIPQEILLEVKMVIFSRKRILLGFY